MAGIEPTVTVDDGGAPAAPSISIENGVATVVDAKGREIKVKRLSALNRMQLMRAAGAEASGNQAWMGYALLAASVTSLHGVAATFPSSVLQIEGMAARLGDEGFDAVGIAWEALNPNKDGGVAEAAKNL